MNTHTENSRFLAMTVTLDQSQLSLSTAIEVSKALNSFVSRKGLAEQSGEAQINAPLDKGCV